MDNSVHYDKEIVSNDVGLVPSAILPIFFQFLPAPDLIQAHFVCHDWRDVLTNNPFARQWFHRQLLLHHSPFASIPPSLLQTNREELNSLRSLKELYQIRTNLIYRDLPHFWKYGVIEDDRPDPYHPQTATFRESCKFGKCSRWVLNRDFDDSSFIVDLAWVVRLLCCLGPPGYHTLDGADQKPYNPMYSMRSTSHAPGWRMIQHYHSVPVETRDQLLFDEMSFSGLFVLRETLVRHRNNERKNHGECEPSHSKAVMEATKRLPDLVHHAQWNRAVDLNEHTKLIAFLMKNPISLRGLFWDAGGVECRNVENMASANHHAWGIERSRYPNPRQLPHLFNMAKLGKHVEALSWEDVFLVPED